MFAVIQFPLTDVRTLVDGDTGRVGAPLWPIVNIPDDPYKAPFVRGFGRVRKRTGGGVDEWAAEDSYCDISHAIRFAQSFRQASTSATMPFARRYCAFRRLFWDGLFKQWGSFVGRAEIGFGLRGAEGAASLDASALGELLDTLLRQPVYVARPRKSPASTKPGPLSNAGSSLAKACLLASSHANQGALLKGHEWWLQSGAPYVVVEYVRDREVTSLPPRTVPVMLKEAAVAGIRVFLGRRVLDGRERAVWFFECNPGGADRDALRRLRINVTRLQSTFASLKVLADLQLKQRVAPASAAARANLQACLSRHLPLLYHQQSLGFACTEFLRAALTLEEALTPGEFATLRELYQEPGRGLAAQLDHASEAVKANQPAPAPPILWDVFIAHGTPDVKMAEDLYAELTGKCRVFLATRCVRLGDDWDLVIPDAQRRAYMTVVLIGASADSAYYLRSEIAAAIGMARVDDQRYRVVPIYLQGSAGREAAQPYGLNLKQGLEITGAGDWPGAASQILETLASTIPRVT
jgi:hypothetical protein